MVPVQRRAAARDSPRVVGYAMAWFWKLVAVVCLLLAAAAALLPLLPAAPFLLMAATAATRGWPWLADRLRGHATLGPAITAWQTRGALARPAKGAALLGLAVSLGLGWASPAPTWMQLALSALLAACAAWIWRRPEP
jgi:hypothetical protein